MRDFLFFSFFFFQFNEADCLQNGKKMALGGHFFSQLSPLSALFHPMIVFAEIVEELFRSNRCDCSFLL